MVPILNVHKAWECHIANDTNAVYWTRNRIAKSRIFWNDLRTVYRLSIRNITDLLHEQRENGHTNSRAWFCDERITNKMFNTTCSLKMYTSPILNYRSYRWNSWKRLYDHWTRFSRYVHNCWNPGSISQCNSTHLWTIPFGTYRGDCLYSTNQILGIYLNLSKKCVVLLKLS